SLSSEFAGLTSLQGSVVRGEGPCRGHYYDQLQGSPRCVLTFDFKSIRSINEGALVNISAP
ncbi:MAG: hypothetical protein ABJC66_00555, partial [Gammaproteobacteria bacterium]